jgi:hypothetical protein
MNAREAVTLAKQYLLEMLLGEDIEPPTLEEVWFEDKKKVWKVTLGVRRKSVPDSAAGRLGLSQLPDYKTVTILERDGSVVSVKDRLLQGLEQ